LDGDAVEQLRLESERIGIAIKTNVQVESIEKVDGTLRVNYIDQGKAVSVQADRVVNGTGRIANVQPLDLEAAGVQHDGLRIDVDEYLRSVSNPSVWVAGDALVTSAQLSPVATYEGRIVGHNIVNGCGKTPEYSVIPSAVYTVPALSSVGMTEAQCQESGLDFEVKISDISGWLSAKFYAETAAWSKVIVGTSSGKILGAHIIGHHGEELIHLFALAMRHNITADELGESMFAFPTFSSDIKSMV
jgi:glutathione reductase (NADPH)